MGAEDKHQVSHLRGPGKGSTVLLTMWHVHGTFDVEGGYAMRKERHNRRAESAPRSLIGAGIALGAAIGAGIGAAIENMGGGVAIGVALGVALGTFLDKQRKSTNHPKTS